VIVTPADARAYTIVAESVDRSGMARATLAPRPGMAAEIPPLRKRPLATMKDMGMDMSTMDHGAGDSGSGGMDHGAMPGMDHGQMPEMDHGAADTAAGQSNAGMDMGSMRMRDPANAPQVKMGPGVQTIAPMPVDRTGEGLGDVGHRVLTYRDLVALERNPDVRAPARELQIHLTGNMERYMWSFDGEKLSEVKAPIPFLAGERVRVTLINDTMMAHPIHLHGHFFELVTGHGDHSPRKHTVNVLPGGKVSWDVTAVPGDWAFHCHMLYHMHAGMMQVVSVRPFGEAA
jgi:CopA family copper-resistance protein